MIAKTVSFLLAPFCLLCLRLTGIPYLRAFTFRKYQETCFHAHGRNRVWIQIEVSLIVFIHLVICLIPGRLIPVFKNAIAGVLFVVMPSFRKVIETNLEIAFKEKYNPEERKMLARKSFFHSLDSLIWLVETTKLTREKILKTTKVKGAEHLQAAMKKGRGVILCAPHHSRFPYAPIYVGLGEQLPISMIIRRLDNPIFGEMVYLTLRHLSVGVIIRSHWALKTSLNALKEGEAVLLFMDQNVAVGGVFVPFFGVPASTSDGVHFLQSKTGASVICCHVHYRDGGYEMEFSPEIEGKILKDKVLLLTKINGYFEEVISRAPGSYLWMHPRWKKRPEGEETLYPRVKKLNKL